MHTRFMHFFASTKSRKITALVVIAGMLFSSFSVLAALEGGNSQGMPEWPIGWAPALSSEHAVTFTESGLPSSSGGTVWSVNLSNAGKGVVIRGSGSSITFQEKNGKYSYNVSKLVGFIASPGSGNVTINGSGRIIAVDFYNQSQNVIFTESGIGTVPVEPWTVNLTRYGGSTGIVQTSMSTSMAFSEPNGSYNFSVTPPSGYSVVTSSGTISVSGTAFYENLQFSNTEYVVSVNETGLGTVQSGSLWSATLKNTSSGKIYTENSHFSEINFTVPDGHYALSVLPPPYYNYTTTSASFYVTGSNYYASVQFHSQLYTLRFQERGLPTDKTGMIWGIGLTNTSHSSFTEYTNNTTLIFNIPDGTYSYSAQIPSNFSAEPFGGSGSVTMNKGNVSIVINFIPQFFTEQFRETGLPSPGGSVTPWSVKVGQVVYNSSTNIVDVSLPLSADKNFSFAVLPPLDFTASVNGFGNVTQPSIPPGQITTYTALKNVTFSYKQGPVPKFHNSTFQAVDEPFATLNFTEVGLPAGSSWTVGLNNTTKSEAVSSTFNTIYFSASNLTGVGLVVGTKSKFYFSAFPTNGYYPTSDGSNTVFWNGTIFENVTIHFTNSLHSVMFNETGLPYLSAWSITVVNSIWAGGIAGQQELVNNENPVEFSLPNGNYHYIASSVAGFDPVTKSGNFTVNNGTILPYPSPISIAYVSASSNLNFTETGLPSDSRWAVMIEAFNLTERMSTLGGGPINFRLPNGTYYYSVVNLSQNNPYVPVAGYGLVTVNGSKVEMNGKTLLSSGINISFTSRNYAGQFIETGLPSGSTWSVDIEGVGTISSGHSGSIHASLANGSYYFTSWYSSNYSSNRSSGIIAVNGSSWTERLLFTPVAHPITFNVSGLPTGTVWNVIVNGASYSTNKSSLAVNVTNGTYFYRFMDAQNVFTYYPFSSMGSKNMTGSTKTVLADYKDFTYRVSFEETGISTPIGNDTFTVNYTVKFNAISNFSNGINFVNFTAQNGTYPFTVSIFRDWVPSPSSQDLTLNGTPPITVITFTLEKLYSTKFIENNLPPGTQWGLDLSGPYNNSSAEYTGSSVSFLLPNGTYSYFVNITTDKKFKAPSPGTFKVNGASPAAIYLNYTNVTFTVKFIENGLPTGTLWKVNVNGTNHTSVTNTVSIPLQNGTYNFRYYNTTNFTVKNSITGIITVDGYPVTAYVNYSAFLYTLSFKETGIMKSSPDWNITVNNVLESSHGSRYINLSEANGTYSYTVQMFQDYNPTVLSGIVTVAGKTSVQVSFLLSRLYAVTFISNLTSGWGLKLQGSYNYSNETYNSNTTTFNLPNGSYSYSVYSSSNRYRAPAGSTFVVNSGGKTIYLNFTKEVFKLAFLESGLPAGTRWFVKVDGNTYNSTNSSFYLMVFNGTYNYTYQNVTNFNITSGQVGSAVINGTAQSVSVTYRQITTSFIPPPPPSKGFSLPFYAYIVIISAVVVGAGIGAAVMMQRKKKE